MSKRLFAPSGITPSVCKPSWNPTQRLVSLWLTVNWTLSRFRLTRLAVPQDFHNQNLHVIKRKDFEIKCVNDHLKLNSLIKQILSTYHLRQCMNISLENLDVDIYRVNKKKNNGSLYISGKPPTYPSPKSLKGKCWLRGGVGGQFPRSV